MVCSSGCGPSTDDLNTSDDDTFTSDDDDTTTPTDDDTTTPTDDDTTTPTDDDDLHPTSVLTAEPAEVAFGVVSAFSSYPSSFELVVTGESEVTISASAVSGTCADVFSVADLAGTVIPAGGTLQVDVDYEPTDAATDHAEVFVYSNAESSLLTVLLSGTAQVDLADVDNDGDGHTENQGDCDDTDELMFPGAPERCNEVDDDCDGVVPEDETADEDGDGAVACDDCDDHDAAMNLQDNDFDAWITCTGDCDDTTSAVRPGAQESCNGLDDDCDGVVAPDELADHDADGYLACEDCDDSDPGLNHDDLDGDWATTCNGDCDDNDPQVYPAAIDTPGDGIDANCDGID